MKYALLICSDGNSTPKEDAVIEQEMPNWVEENDARGVRLFGHALAGTDTATTVLVRDSGTIISDGPFAETKEFVAGFDILECADQQEAIAVAAKHPLSWFHSVEVRQFREREPWGDEIPPERWQIRPRVAGQPGTRYLLTMCVDGIPGTEEEEASFVRDAIAWLEEMTTRGALVFGSALTHANTATTVCVRDGETMLSDGPFAETKEFIAGFCIVDCDDLDEAIEVVATHPIARFHRVEVRPFAHDALGGEHTP